MVNPHSPSTSTLASAKSSLSTSNLLVKAVIFKSSFIRKPSLIRKRELTANEAEQTIQKAIVAKEQLVLRFYFVWWYKIRRYDTDKIYPGTSKHIHNKKYPFF